VLIIAVQTASHGSRDISNHQLGNRGSSTFQAAFVKDIIAGNDGIKLLDLAEFDFLYSNRVVLGVNDGERAVFACSSLRALKRSYTVLRPAPHGGGISVAIQPALYRPANAAPGQPASRGK
jgi:hypothetical protein